MNQFQIVTNITFFNLFSAFSSSTFWALFDQKLTWLRHVLSFTSLFCDNHSEIDEGNASDGHVDSVNGDDMNQSISFHFIAMQSIPVLSLSKTLPSSIQSYPIHSKRIPCNSYILTTVRAMKGIHPMDMVIKTKMTIRVQLGHSSFSVLAVS